MAKRGIPPLAAVGIIILVGAIFAGSIPFFQNSPDFIALNPVEQYVLWNLGLSLLFVGFFGVLISSALSKRYSLSNIFVHGLVTFAVFSFVIDMLAPPFALNSAGEFIIPTGQTLEGTSVDYATAWFYQQAFNVSGPLLFWLTYLVTPIIAFLVFLLVLGPKRMLQVYRGSL